MFDVIAGRKDEESIRSWLVVLARETVVFVPLIFIGAAFGFSFEVSQSIGVSEADNPPSEE